jgi:tetratricopeptide (TPR) repeat protein
MLAQHYLDLKQPQKVLESLEKPSLDLENVDYWKLRAFALYELERYPEALENTQKGLSFEPENIQLLYLLSRIQGQLKNFAEAEKAVLHALHMSPENAILLARYAMILGQAGQLSKAQQVIDEASRLNPDENNVITTKTFLAYLKGDRHKVKVYSQALLKEDPDNFFGHYMLGQSSLEKHHTRSAEKHLRRAASLAPELTTVTDATRESRFYNHPLMWPLYPLYRLGRIRFWLLSSAIMVGLAMSGLNSLAGLFVMLYLFVVIYSWIVPRLLRRYLNRHR